MMSRAELAKHLLPDLCEDTRARLLVQLNLGLSARAVADDFGLPLDTVKRLAYKAAVHTIESPGAGIEDEQILECSAAHITAKWADRNHNAIPLTKHGEAERSRRKESAARADAILKSLGLPPTSGRNVNDAIHVRPAHIIAPNRSARAGSKAAETERRRKAWLKESDDKIRSTRLVVE